MLTQVTVKAKLSISRKTLAELSFSVALARSEEGQILLTKVLATEKSPLCRITSLAFNTFSRHVMILIPGIGGGGGRTLKVCLSKGIPPKPSKPDHVTETKIVYFVILFKTKDFIL